VYKRDPHSGSRSSAVPAAVAAKAKVTRFVMTDGLRSLLAVRRATAAVFDGDGEVVGHGLMLSEQPGARSSVVLTCFHVAAAVPGHKLSVAVRDHSGRFGGSARAVFDESRSCGERDVAILRVEWPAPPRPLLHALNPDSYDGGLPARASGFTSFSPPMFDGFLGPSTPLTIDNGADRYSLAHVFTLRAASDSRPGISGAPVSYEGGVVGLAHFARDATATEAREVYVVPLSAWTDLWPQLEQWIEPLVDEPLRNAARVVRASELVAGLATQNEDPELTIAEYRPDVYVPHPAAQRVEEVLASQEIVLISGRPLSGKTRLALEVSGLTPEAWAVIPRVAAPPGRFETAGLRDLEVILLSDDLHEAARRPNVLLWRRQLLEAGARVRTVLTCRDGHDLAALREDDPKLVGRVSNAIVLLSADAHGSSDFPPDRGRRLGQLLGLTASAFEARFDGTPGSLTVDVAMMCQRYERLRDTVVGEVAGSRLLDSLKLLLVCGQFDFEEQRVRLVAEEIRGSAPIGSETWEAVCRRTADAGFGAFVDGVFKTYTPLLEHGVLYESTPASHEAVSALLRVEKDWSGLIAFGRSDEPRPTVRKDALDFVVSHSEDADQVAVAQLLLAYVWRDLEESSHAIAQLRQMHESAPADRLAQAGVHLGILLEEEERFEEAAVAWASVVDSARSQHAAEAAARLGMMLLSRGKADEAAGPLRRAAESENNAVAGVAAYNLACAPFELEADDRRRLLERAVQSGDDQAAPAAALQLAAEEPGAEEWDRLLPVLRRASESDNRVVADAATIHIAVRQALCGQLDVASPALRRLAERGDNNALSSIAGELLGNALRDMGRNQEALVFLDRVRHASHEPQRSWAAATAGEILADAGRYDEAADALQQAASSRKPHPEATLNLGVVEFRRGNYVLARSYLEQAKRSRQRRIRNYAAAALAQLDLHQDQGHPNSTTIAALESAIDSATPKEHASFQFALAQLHAAANNAEAARSLFESAIRSDGPWATNAKYEYARLLLRIDDVPRAIELLADAASEGLDEAALSLGRVHRDASDMAAAVAAFKQAAGSEDTGVAAEARVHLALALADAGSFREALGTHQRILDDEKDPARIAVLRNSMAITLTTQGEWSQAAEFWEQIRTDGDPTGTVRWAYWLVKANLERDRYPEATRLFAEMQSTDTGWIDAAVAVADAAQARGDLQTARATLRQIVRSGKTAQEQRARVTLGSVEARLGNDGTAVELWSAVMLGADREAAGAAAYNVGLNRLEDGDLSGAEAPLLQAAETGVEEVGELAPLALGRLYRERGDLPQADRWLRRVATGSSPEADEAAFLLGQALAMRDAESPEADEFLRQAASSVEEGVRGAAALALGLLSRKRNDHSGALRWFDASDVPLDDRRAGCWEGGCLALLMGDIDGGCRRLRRATTSSDPSIADGAWLALGTALLEHGHENDAADALERAAGSEIENVRLAARVELLDLATDRNDAETVQRIQAELLATDHVEYRARAACIAGTYWLSNGDRQRAAPALEIAVSEIGSPWADMAAINLAALRADDLAGARALLDPLIAGRDRPLRRRAAFALGEALHMHGQDDDAIRALAIALSAPDDDTSAKAALLTGAIHVNAGRCEAAACAIEHPAAAKEPGFGRVVLELLAQADSAFVEERGPTLLRQVLASTDVSLRTLAALQLGRLLIVTGEAEEAVGILRPFVDDERLGPSVLTRLGNALETTGKPDEALSCWELAVDRDPNQAEAALWAGAEHYDADRTEQALHYWTIASTAQDPTAAATASMNLGVLCSGDDPARAARLWEAAAASGVTDAATNLDRLLEWFMS
jgi:lipopolysaccharide biosynthesis regulator YciM